MPSQILHALFGEDVITSLHRRIENDSASRRFVLAADKALKKINLDYRSAFILGCQGPDIFYHSRQRPVALEYGSLLHRRGYGIFTAGLLKLGLPDPPPDEDDIRNNRREKAINALGVYALGFMTHAVLDRFCHPYIVYKSLALDAGGKPLPESRFAHPFFERIIDTLMLKELRGVEAAAWDQDILSAICENPPLGLKELIARSLAAGFPDRVKKDRMLALRIDNTFADCAWFYHFTAPVKKAKADGAGSIDIKSLPYFFPENLPAEVDFLNMKHKAWYYPRTGTDPAESAGTQKADYRSFPDIYAQAVQAAADAFAPCILRYLDSGIFPIVAAAGSIGNGSLSIQDGEGKPCAPNRTCPLPLDTVLAEQARIRGLTTGGISG